MTTVQQPNQDLFNYLANELNVIALQTEMQEIEAIVMSNFKQQIKDAYNQGYRECIEESGHEHKEDFLKYIIDQIYGIIQLMELN